MVAHMLQVRGVGVMLIHRSAVVPRRYNFAAPAIVTIVTIVAILVGLLVQPRPDWSRPPLASLELANSEPAYALADTASNTASLDFGKAPLSFEVNAGQAESEARFLARMPGKSGSAFAFRPNEVAITLNSPNSRTHSSLRIQFLNAQPAPQISGGGELPGKVNYLLGSDPVGWRTNLPTYSSITYTGLYPGVDLTYEGTGGRLKGTYIVAPGVDSSLIRWRYKGAKQGAEGVRVDAGGNLQIVVAGVDVDANANADANNATTNTTNTTNTTLTEAAPVAWQEIGGKRRVVSARYRVAEEGSIGFLLGEYDKAYPLTIDPTLTFSTYLGGTGSGVGRGIAVDGQGNVYVTGLTSNGFPTANPYQPNPGGSSDAFITKLDPSGTRLIYSTYLGGSGQDHANDIAVDSAGNAYVTGLTGSTNFPTADPYQPVLRGPRDAFVTKLNAQGSALVYSTYLGGSNIGGTVGDEVGIGIAVDSADSAYVGGASTSRDFPLVNPFGAGGSGVTTPFLSKFSADGRSLLYSTYLSSFERSSVSGMAIDGSGNAYLVGETLSEDFPIRNAFQPQYRGVGDGFVAKLNPSAAGDASLVYSTYLGGSAWDQVEGVATDTQGNAHVTGWTQSEDFPIVNAYQPRLSGRSVFVTKLKADGSALVYSTYMGSGEGTAIAVDGQGNAYVTGLAYSSFPTVAPIQPRLGGGYDAFVFGLSPLGHWLLYSTFLGGTEGDVGYGIAVDERGSAYVTGATFSTNFPTANPYQATNPSNYLTGFVSKIDNSCALSFSDVAQESAFYPYVRCLACRGALGGYDDGTFRPNNLITRGQLAKIVSNAAGLQLYSSPVQQFEDVPPGSLFYLPITELAYKGIVRGYPCGGPGEPCVEPKRRSYFRPGANATRGQIAKIVSEAASLNDTPVGQTFEDVPFSNPFYVWVERLVSRGVMGGYECGGPEEPCRDGNRPYFRWGTNTTRGQVSKIVANTFFPGCSPPAP